MIADDGRAVSNVQYHIVKKSPPVKAGKDVNNFLLCQ
jgi:hypothetical protein